MATRRRAPRLFRYSSAPAASRTLKALRTAWPENTFTLLPQGSELFILARKPDGTAGLVARAPLASFGKEV